jgi:hypothetical protein
MQLNVQENSMKRTLAVLSLVFVIALAANSQSTDPQQPEKLGKKQLATLVANAKTPADHARLAGYYAARAQNDLAEARFHGQMAADFHQNSAASSAKFATGTIKHCQYLQAHLTEEAAKMHALARQHEQMARSGQ